MITQWRHEYIVQKNLEQVLKCYVNQLQSQAPSLVPKRKLVTAINDAKRRQKFSTV